MKVLTDFQETCQKYHNLSNSYVSVTNVLKTALYSLTEGGLGFNSAPSAACFGFLHYKQVR